MKKKHPVKASLQTIVAAALAIVLFGTMMTIAQADDAKPAETATTNAVSPAVVPESIKPASHASLTGAELYSIHCNRCHAERYPTERTAAQWKTIMLHMEVRASIPAKQARLILSYLQENSGR